MSESEAPRQNYETIRFASESYLNMSHWFGSARLQMTGLNITLSSAILAFWSEQDDGSDPVFVGAFLSILSFVFFIISNYLGFLCYRNYELHKIFIKKLLREEGLKSLLDEERQKFSEGPFIIGYRHRLAWNLINLILPICVALFIVWPSLHSILFI